MKNKYERILYMGVGRSGLADENSVIAKAINKQVAKNLSFEDWDKNIVPFANLMGLTIYIVANVAKN